MNNIIYEMLDEQTKCLVKINFRQIVINKVRNVINKVDDSSCFVDDPVGKIDLILLGKKRMRAG